MDRRMNHLLTVVASIGLILSVTSCGGFFVDPQLTSIAVTPASPSMVQGTSQAFTAVGTYEDGSREVLGSVSWTTSNASIVAIDGAGNAHAIAPGSATVTATKDVATGSTTVSVVTSPLTAIAVNPINPTVSFAAHTTEQFSATATFGDGSTLDITNSATWNSSDTTVATINTTGLATLTGKVGTTTIKATSGTVSNTSLMTVIP